MSGPGAHDAAHNPVRTYIGIFAFLTIVTAIEMFPLFGLWDIPAPVLIGLSVAKFVTVCYFFMHLLGDAAILKRVFFIPLMMAGVTVMMLMFLFDSWTLPRRMEGHEDSPAVQARYRTEWSGRCNAWVTSAATGNEYCASPAIGFTTLAAYEALKPSGEADPRLADFDKKSPEEKKAALMAVGEEVYGKNCGACHQANGQGTPTVFPPLAADPVATGPFEKHVEIVLKGMSGVAINGVTYAAAMPAWPQLTDEQLAAVLTFERNSWGNDAGIVEPAQIAPLR